MHFDFAGPFIGKMFPLAEDVHSKWPEVVTMTSTSAEKTIEDMRKMFAAHGFPEQVVIDNGPQFTSQEFAEFMRKNSI